MAGPLDILRGLGGGGGGGNAPRPSLPAYSSEDAAIMKQATQSWKSIAAAIKEGSKNWEKLGDARALRPARIALGKLHGEQIKFNKVMADSTSTLNQQAAAYGRLAKAQEKARGAVRAANKDMNENRGILGRTKNLLDELAKHKWAALMTAAIRDLNLVFGTMNQQFDILARSGQLVDTSFSGLASTTFVMGANMKFATLQASAMGISADDSNKAFARLTETFGGTLDVAKSLQSDWYEMSKLARLSGLSMNEMAGLADQGFKRLGESVHTTMNNIVAMSKITKELVGRFGKGTVNTREFASAVNTLAYSSGFYNQNTRMVIESLGREISVQLALGKSREAATQSAVKNLQMAGNVNIVGIDKFRSEIMQEYAAADDKTAFLKKLTDDFGSEGELIASMLERGDLNTSKGLLAFQDIVKGSTKLQGSMLESMRVMALAGPQQLLAMGVDFNKALRMEAESNLMADKLQAIARGDEDAVKNLFKGEVETPEQSALIKELRDDPTMDRAQMLKRFYATGGSEDLADAAMKEAGITAGEEEWKKYVDKEIAVGWFVGITNFLGIISTALGQLPLALGGVIGALMARSVLSGALKNLGAGGGMLGRAGGMLGRGAAMAGRGAMMGAKVLGPLAVIGTQIYAWADGMKRAAKIMGRSEESIGPLERVAAGAANAVSALTLGIVDASKLARGETLVQRAAYATSFGMLEKGLGLIGKLTGTRTLGFGDVNVSKEEQMKQQYDHAKKMGWVREGETLSGYSDRVSKPKQVTAQESQAIGDAEMATPATAGGTATPTRGAAAGVSAGAGGTAKATASISQGNLILEVSNWEDVLAESQHNLAANAG